MNALWIVLFILAVGAVVYFSWRAKMRRRQGMAAFAKQYGMQYAIEDPFGLVNFAFQLFSKGDGRGVENVVWGEWQGLSVRSADYWYYDEHTDSNGHRTKSYRHYSVAIVDVGLGLLPCSIAPEGFLTRLADNVGLRDIEFESEEFNRAFNVKAPDREYAFKLVDARMMHYLLTAPGFGFETVGPWVLVYGNRRKPTELVPILGAAKGFAEQIPRLVRTEFAVQAENPKKEEMSS